MGTGRLGSKDCCQSSSRTQIFQGYEGYRGHSEIQSALFWLQGSFRQIIWFNGPSSIGSQQSREESPRPFCLGHFAIKKKRKLFPGSSVASPGLFALLHPFERKTKKEEKKKEQKNQKGKEKREEKIKGEGREKGLGDTRK